MCLCCSLHWSLIVVCYPREAAILGGMNELKFYLWPILNVPFIYMIVCFRWCSEAVS
jgi:hypothetical protein